VAGWLPVGYQGKMDLGAEAIFERVLLPLYPQDARRNLAQARKTDANPGNNPSILRHLSEAAEIFAENARPLLGLELDFTDASVHRLSHALTKDKRDAWLAAAELANVIIHGAAYVGECIVRRHGGRWLVRNPLWESRVHLESRAGVADLAVLHWWLKALADGAKATLADRYRALVEVPCARPEDLAPIAPSDRVLPRITKVRYDVFYKYLRARVPELRDLGADFPSPERFTEYAFRWLDFHWLGGGRMLLVSGLGRGGLHLFWLTTSGFDKSVLVACDAFPEPVVRVEDDKIVCLVSRSDKLERHELLWWGP
jgi:hypothetical protein